MRRWLLAGCVAGIVGLVLQAPLHAADGASPAASVERGAQLFALSCATCHGANGTGGVAPSLVGVGEAAADFQLRTGRMPRTSLDTGQAPRKPPAFNDEGIRDLVAYVASLGDGPAIPNVTAGSDVQRGLSLFIGNCAPCHGASAGGGVVGGGAIAPALRDVSPTLVGEAMLTGPGQMPKFPLPSGDVDAIAGYLAMLNGTPAHGGLDIGAAGPVPEGFVAWLVGIGLLVLIAWLVGRQWGAPNER
jgi:ubiquinol-cytochrome c reductase cytochrome c subunit